MIKKNRKKIYFIIELLILTALFIGVNNLLPLNIFAYSVETEDPAIFEENYYYKVSDSELMHLSKDKVEGLWLPAEPSVCGPEGIPVDDPTAMISSDGEYIPSEFQRSEGSGLSYIAPSNKGLFLKYLKEDTLKNVLPPDDRANISDTTVFPWCTIVKLYIIAADGTKLIGSGAIIDDFHVLTAGHCVWSHDYGDNWAQSIMVVPGLDGSYMPFYYAWKTNSKTYTGWVYNKDPNHDWAIITLDRNIGRWTDWMGRETHSDLSWYSGRIFNTAGYPADLSSGLAMYHDADTADYATDYRLYYYMDTYGGQSGSPVWAYNSTAGRRIVAIHAYGSSTINSGTRLNQDKFDRIITWLDADSPISDYADLIDDGQAWSGFTPAEVRTGDSFSVWNNVRNIGTEHSGSFTVSYYCSDNTTITTSDDLIGTCSVSSISPFSWDDSDWAGSFPSNIPTGVYYVGWIIDSDDDVTEFNEDNNTAYCEDGTLIVDGDGGNPPQVTTNNASGVTSTSAQLNGNLDDTGGLSCDVWFEYGETTSYGSSTTKQSKSSVGTFNHSISSLDPNTTYHFKACASNAGGPAYGDDKEFITPPPGTSANLELTPATQTVLIGAKGTVNIVIEDVTNLMGADITLNFDDSKLKYDSSAPGSFWLPEGVLVFSPVATGGSVNIHLSAEVATVKSGTGTIITVTFERIASGVTDICFGVTDLRDESWQPITHTKGECCSFTECIGDFNGDLQVNFGDLGIFAMAYRSSVGDDNWNPICDIDGDGSVGFNDLGIFAMHYRDDCRP